MPVSSVPVPRRVRRRPDWSSLPPPVEGLRVVVVMPVRNEARRLPAALRALAMQRQADGTPYPRDRFEVVVLANNCDDASVAIAKDFAARRPGFALHVVEVRFPPPLAHVGHARSCLMAAACRRLRATAGGRGVIASTDGDTRVAPDWLAEICAAIDAGADAVGGRIVHDDDVALPKKLVGLARRDDTYQRLRSRLEHALDPDPFDPWPRHHQHFGASLALTVSAYRRVGGMPAAPFLEDEALVRRLREEDLRVRHSVRVRVVTSARRRGRVAVGLSWQLREWQAIAAAGEEPRVEHPRTETERLVLRRRLRGWWHAARTDTVATTVDPRQRQQLGLLARRLSVPPRTLLRQWSDAATFGRFWSWIESRVAHSPGRTRAAVGMRDAIATLRTLIDRHSPSRASRTRPAGTSARASNARGAAVPGVRRAR